MPHHLPPLAALRAFEVAARTANFSAAANELGVTRGAVSKQIKILEEWLGQPLFTRSGKQAVPTPHARAFAREISEAFDRVVDAAGRYGSADAAKYVLRVNAPATFAMRWLIPRLPAYHAKYPRVEVRVSTSTTATQEPLRGPFDLAIRRSGGPWHQHEAIPFLQEWNTLVASPNLLAGQPLRNLADIQKHVMLSTETRPREWEDWLASAGYDGPLAEHRPRYDHFYVTIQATIDGLGLAIAPFPVLSDEVAAGRLVIPFPNYAVARPSYYVLAPYDTDKSPTLMAFRRWLVSVGRQATMPEALAASISYPAAAGSLS